MDRERLRVMLAHMETALAETRANLARVEHSLRTRPKPRRSGDARRSGIIIAA